MTRTKRIMKTSLLCAALLFVLCAGTLLAESQVAKVVSLFGSVKVQHANSSTWEMLSMGAELTESDKIRTDLGAEVKILLEDSSSIVIQENSLVSLEAFSKTPTQKKTETKMFFGSIFAKVMKQKEDDFKVSTPTIVAAVRGTSFGVNVDGGVGKVISSGDNKKGSLVVYVPGKEDTPQELDPGKEIVGTTDGDLSSQVEVSEGSTMQFEYMEVQEESQNATEPPSLEVNPIRESVTPGNSDINVKGSTDPLITVTVYANESPLGSIQSSMDGSFSGKFSLASYLESGYIDIRVSAENYVGVSEEYFSVTVKGKDEGGDSSSEDLISTNTDGTTVTNTEPTSETDTLVDDSTAGEDSVDEESASTEDGAEASDYEFELTAPVEGDIFKVNTIMFKGKGSPGATVSVNGVSTVVGDNGMFTVSATLSTEGDVEVEVVYTEEDGTTETVKRKVFVDTIAPVVEEFVVENLTDGVVLEQSAKLKITVSADTESILVNGVPARKVSDGVFGASVSSARDGVVSVSLGLKDKVGHTAKETKQVEFDVLPPFLIVREPLKLPKIVGVTENGALITISVNGQSIVDENKVSGSFSFDLTADLLSYQEEKIKVEVVAKDEYNRQSSPYATSLYYDTNPPTIDEPSYTVNGKSVTISGSIGESGSVTFNMSEVQTVTTDNNGNYSLTVSIKQIGSPSFVIEAVDTAGNKTKKGLRLRLPPAPPQLK